jgi:hypothetical protein
MEILLVHLVLPLAAIRSIAICMRTFFQGSVLGGLVTGLGYYVLGLTLWGVLVLTLPPLWRQFHVALNTEKSALLASLMLIPYWLTGIFEFLPTDPFWLLAWTRLLAGLISLAGIFSVYHCLHALHVQEYKHPIACITIALGAALALFLSLVVGLGTTLSLFLLYRLFS